MGNVMPTWEMEGWEPADKFFPGRCRTCLRFVRGGKNVKFCENCSERILICGTCGNDYRAAGAEPGLCGDCLADEEFKQTLRSNLQRDPAAFRESIANNARTLRLMLLVAEEEGTFDEY